MRKLVVQQWVTVDNIAAEEDGGLSFVSGEPFSENHQPCVQASFLAVGAGGESAAGCHRRRHNAAPRRSPSQQHYQVGVTNALEGWRRTSTSRP